MFPRRRFSDIDLHGILASASLDHLANDGAAGVNPIDMSGTGVYYPQALAFGAPNQIFFNDGTGVFTEMAGVVSNRSDPTKALALADIDNDGDIDVRWWRPNHAHEGSTSPRPPTAW